jgi:hypothetical protein
LPKRENALKSFLRYKYILFNFEIQSTFMNEKQPLETLQDIHHMMERSSRFISLSGLGGIGTGICGLAGSYLAYREIQSYHLKFNAGVGAFGNDKDIFWGSLYGIALVNELLKIAAGVLLAAIVVAFIFTYIKARKMQLPVWDHVARRLVINLSVPLIAGGIFIVRLLQAGNNEFAVPASLVFYGLALMNAAKYTVGEIWYLGFIEIIIGIVCLFYPAFDLYGWAFGFGVLHIVYGSIMWVKYDRHQQSQAAR